MIMASIALQWVLVPRVLAALDFPRKNRESIWRLPWISCWVTWWPQICRHHFGSILIVHKLFRKFRLWPQIISCPFLNPFHDGSTQIWSYKQDVDPENIIHDLQKILMRTPLARDRYLRTPGWYGFALALGTGQAVGWCTCANCC